MNPSGNPKILVATATYNEANNIGEFIARLRSTMGPSQHLLIIDDNSPDGTSGVVRKIMIADNAVHLVTRPGKSGLGSAHKLMKIHAMANGYDYLVTMDADLSHRPEEIPLLVSQAGENVFVIGSRYASGGKSGYKGFRKAVSLAGNLAARVLLGIGLKEFTTSFRVFDVNLLRKAPLYRLKSNGYSYFMEVVSLMDELGARSVEVPIDFRDRENDTSKIPRSQVFKSLFNLVALAIRRRMRPLRVTESRMDYGECRLCHQQALLPVWEGGPAGISALSSEDMRCSSIQNALKEPPLTECLCCGVLQIPALASGSAVGDLYSAAEDDTYLSHFNVKLRTFRNAYRKLSGFLPAEKLLFLDVGSYYGAFLEVIKAEGHTGWGVEPSRTAARYSREVLGHDVVNELFTGRPQFPGVHFGVISAWDVIEHLEDPDSFLQEIEKLLQDDGVFVLSTIIVDSLIARMLRKRWHWILPMHLTYFRKGEIMRLLQKHGFEVLAYLNHTHYASVPYALRGLGKNKSPFFREICCCLAGILPESVVLPIALGDVRMLVCRKARQDEHRPRR